MYLRWQQDWSEFDEINNLLAEWKKTEKQLQSKILNLT